MTRYLITGSNRGLGLEMVRHLSQRENVTIFATCRKPVEADVLNTIAEEHPNKVMVVQLDVTNQDSIDASVEVVKEHTDGLDVLINNAAINPPRRYQSFETLDAEGFTFMLQVNTVAPLMIVKAYADLLKAGMNTKIVNISSQLGSLTTVSSGNFGYGYTTSKAGLNMVTRCLAGDLGPEGIICVMLHPGWVQTDMGGANANLTPDESITGVLNVIDGLTPQDNGMFYRWDGSVHPW